MILCSQLPTREGYVQTVNQLFRQCQFCSCPRAIGQIHLSSSYWESWHAIPEGPDHALLHTRVKPDIELLVLIRWGLQGIGFDNDAVGCTHLRLPA